MTLSPKASKDDQRSDSEYKMTSSSSVPRSGAETTSMEEPLSSTDSPGQSTSNEPACHCKELLTELSQMSYKSEICHKHVFYGYCSYGDICRFAHGLHELRAKEVDRRFKTMLCSNWHQVGFCNHGKRCKFLHDEFRIEASPGEFLLIYPRSGIARVEHVPLTDTVRLNLLRASIERQEKETRSQATPVSQKPTAPSWMEARLSHSFSAPDVRRSGSSRRATVPSADPARYRTADYTPSRQMEELSIQTELRSEFSSGGPSGTRDDEGGSVASPRVSLPGAAGSPQRSDDRSELTPSLPRGSMSGSGHSSSQQPYPMPMVPAYIDPYTGQVWPMTYVSQQQYPAYPGTVQEPRLTGHAAPQQFWQARSTLPGTYYSQPVPGQHTQQHEPTVYFQSTATPILHQSEADFRRLSATAADNFAHQEQQLRHMRRRFSAQPRLGGGPQPAPAMVAQEGRTRAGSVHLPQRVSPIRSARPSFAPIREESGPEPEEEEGPSTLGPENPEDPLPSTSPKPAPPLQSSEARQRVAHLFQTAPSESGGNLTLPSNPDPPTRTRRKSRRRRKKGSTSVSSPPG